MKYVHCQSFPLPPRGIGGSQKYSIGFLNTTGNFLRRVQIPRINHPIGWELGDGFSYAAL